MPVVAARAPFAGDRVGLRWGWCLLRLRKGEEAAETGALALARGLLTVWGE